MGQGAQRELLGDVYGGVTAAVVALPLALAFGVASGVGPIAGLYGAIAVGFFAAVFGGTPTQISGPTGPMTVVMAAIVAQFSDNLQEAFAIVTLGGLLQIAFGLMRVGRYVVYTPYSVVSGFMSGIGIIIILIQTLPFIGAEPPPGGPVGAVLAWPVAVENINLHALAVALLSLGIMIFWPGRLARYLPSALAALIIGTLAGLMLFTQAPVIATVPTGLPDLHIPTFDISNLPEIVQPALILALLGSIDSLLTSLVADSLTGTRHDSNRELIGQGIGNAFAGLVGAIPGAGATMRTVVNIRAGGHSRLSGAIHSLVLLGLVLGLGPIAEKIPHAVLAGILMKVGWDIIDWQYLKRFRTAPRDKFMVMLVTLALTVFVDLITAVAVGLILAGFVTAAWMETDELRGLKHLTSPEHASDLDDEERELLDRSSGRIRLLALRGRFSYASAREMVHRIGMGISGCEIVIFDFTEAVHMDTSAALSIESLLATTQRELTGVFVCGLSGNAEETLTRLGALTRLPHSHIAATRLEAIRKATALLEKSDSAADKAGA
jgi:sulfate permease, SulP family